MRRLFTPRTNKYIPVEFTAKQAAFLLIPQREGLFGGGVGGGKSVVLLAGALQYMDIPGYHAVIIRTKLRDMKHEGGLIPMSHEWLRDTDAKYNASDHTWRTPQGSSLSFRYLSNENDKEDWGSTAYHYIGFEELCDFPTEDLYTFVFSRLRRHNHNAALSKVPLRIRATANPRGRGFKWVRSRFVQGNGKRLKPSRTRAFIQSLLIDNPHINHAEYLETLADLPEAEKNRLIHGSWNEMVRGEYFAREHFRVGRPPSYFQKVVRMWDLAATAKTKRNDPDWTFSVRMGLDHQNRWWVLDLAGFRKNPGDVEGEIKRIIALDPADTEHAVFKDPAAAGKLYATALSASMPEFGVVSYSTPGSKEANARGFSVQVTNGNVWIAQGLGGPVLNEYFEQLESFPLGTAHDDAVDASSGAFNYILNAEETLPEDMPAFGLPLFF